MTTSEQYVKKLLHDKYDVDLIKIEETNRKSPDYKCYSDAKLICVAELKDIEYYPPTEETGWKIERLNGVQFASRKDNAPNRVARLIHSAFKQLKEFKPPRVLIFLNRDSRVDVKDLHEAFEGTHVYSNGNLSYVNRESKRIANGKIKHEKYLIDLYIWIEEGKPKMGSDDKIFLGHPTQIGKDLAHQYFSQRTWPKDPR